MAAKLLMRRRASADAEMDMNTTSTTTSTTTGIVLSSPPAEASTSSTIAAAAAAGASSSSSSSSGHSPVEDMLLMPPPSITKHTHTLRGGERGGLWNTASVDQREEDCSSTLRKIFRYTLGQALGLGSSYHMADGAMGEVLEKEAKEKVPEAILTLLSRLVDAERAAAMPRNGLQEGGGYYNQGQPQQQQQQGQGQGQGATHTQTHQASGRKRRLQSSQESTTSASKPKRRVSFSTFDFSVVDTPDPQRHGSDRPMEGVLSSLFLALKAAEVLRRECGGSVVEDEGGMGVDAAGGDGGAVTGAGSAGAGAGASASGSGGGRSFLLGKENERQQVFGAWNNSSHHQHTQPGAMMPDLKGGSTTTTSTTSTTSTSTNTYTPSSTLTSPSKQSLEKLLTALSDLATTATTAASSSDSALALHTQQQQGGGPGAILSLLGDHPHWNQIATAAHFYIKELRLLCLEEHASLLSSRLMGRYHETLSSLVRYELKKVLNLCYCACEFPPSSEEEAEQQLQQMMALQHQQQANAAAAAAGGEGGEGEEHPPTDLHLAATFLRNHSTNTNTHQQHTHTHQQQQQQEEAPQPNCCSAMQILVETASNLQYNSDDPAALFHFALRKLHTKKETWMEFERMAMAAGRASAAAAADGGGGGGGNGEVGVPGGQEEDSNVMQMSQSTLTPTASEGGKAQQEGGGGKVAAGAAAEEEVNSEEQQEEEEGPRHRRARGNSIDTANSTSTINTTSTTDTNTNTTNNNTLPNAPGWWAMTEGQGEEILGFLGAASFLLRVLQDPVVSQAVNNGKWGRVERFAGMISGVMNVLSEDDSLRPLSDLLQLQEELEDVLRGAQMVRAALASSTPEEVLSSVPISHFVPLVPRRKRKRSSRYVKGQMKDMLIWVRSNELPERVVYPHLAPLCVYSAVPGYGEEEEEEDEDEDEEYEGEEEEDEGEEEEGEEGVYMEEGETPVVEVAAV